MVVLTQSAHGQTFSVLHTFTGGNDGSQPSAGLIIDRAGNFYGTTATGGVTDGGVVFKLIERNGEWLLTPLYNTFGRTDSGTVPQAPVTIGPNGTLYGTTDQSGTGDVGTVFNLTPPPRAPPNIIAPWTLNVLHEFAGGSDGADPVYSVLVFDAAGNIYGTTAEGGEGCDRDGCGTVFELTPSGGGHYQETILYKFAGGIDGIGPVGGVIFDSSGNLYGTASSGGVYSCGVAFKLTPSGSGWVKTTIHLFLGDGDGDGCNPASGVRFDSSGNLYGTTAKGGILGGNNGAGTVFELVPQQDGSWSENVLWAFTTGFQSGGPVGNVAMDAAGNLYGTTSGGGAYELGTAFKLTLSNGNWTYTDLHDFSGQDDGKYPYGNALLDSSDNLYGTAIQGGLEGYGTIWKIAP